MSTAAATRRWPPSQSVTSSWLATASPPAARISATTSSAAPARLALGEVVDHDAGPLGREVQGVGPAEAPARTGDDRDAAVERSHRFVLLQTRDPVPG